MVIWVFIGAGLGAMVRFAIISLINRQKGLGTGVFVVNMLGAYLTGLLMTKGLNVTNSALMLTGFLGGLTTYATLMTQTQNQSFWRQMGHLTGVFGLGILAFLLGMGSWLLVNML